MGKEIKCQKRGEGRKNVKGEEKRNNGEEKRGKKGRRVETKSEGKKSTKMVHIFNFFRWKVGKDFKRGWEEFHIGLGNIHPCLGLV